MCSREGWCLFSVMLEVESGLEEQEVARRKEERDFLCFSYRGRLMANPQLAAVDVALADDGEEDDA